VSRTDGAQAGEFAAVDLLDEGFTGREVARAYDGTGVRCDLVESECLYRGETISGRFRVMQVWATVDGRWQLVGVQYTATS